MVKNKLLINLVVALLLDTRFVNNSMIDYINFNLISLVQGTLMFFFSRLPSKE